MFEGISARLQAAFKKLRGRGKLTEGNIRDALREVKIALLEADVNYRVVKDFIESVTERAVGSEVIGSLLPAQQVIKIVYEEMVRLMGVADSELKITKKPSTVMVVGLQGSGKTTVCAKLAYFLKNKGRTVSLIAADTRRPAASLQLEVLGRQAGVPVFGENGEKDALKVVSCGLDEAIRQNIDVVLIDTGGRLHIDDEMMNELAEIKKRVMPQEILLVMDAMTGQDAVSEATEFEKRLGIDGMVLTKLDGDARGGVALSVSKVTGKPIKFAGVGERIDALEPFQPDRIASRILGMGDVLTLVEKVESLVAEDEKRKLERKIARESLTLEDLLELFKLTRKMGGISELVQLIPGGVNLGDGAIDEKKISHVEAIIQSMTVEERRSADIIDGSRRRRIAEGSGTSVQEVNLLIRQSYQMRKLMKGFGKKFIKHSAKGGLKWQSS